MNSYILKIRRSVLTFTGIAVFAVSGPANPAHGADLGEALQHAKWSGIIGTWVDSETKGERVKIDYAWKFENKLIEVNSTMGETKSSSLMGFNPESEEVFIVGGNNKGGGSAGNWSMEGEDAVLDLSFVGAEGEKGSMKITHHRIDDDTIEVTVSSEEREEDFKFTLVRSK